MTLGRKGGSGLHKRLEEVHQVTERMPAHAEEMARFLRYGYALGEHALEYLKQALKHRKRVHELAETQKRRHGNSS